ncbi:hypothetical protein C8F01DRAFT_1092179 [Mycena amicta]|nr:hypothetical protein C8F01DRAFT_1092179 [Mycena amicta]
MSSQPTTGVPPSALVIDEQRQEWHWRDVEISVTVQTCPKTGNPIVVEETRISAFSNFLTVRAPSPLPSRATLTLESPAIRALWPSFRPVAPVHQYVPMRSAPMLPPATAHPHLLARRQTLFPDDPFEIMSYDHREQLRAATDIGPPIRTILEHALLPHDKPRIIAALLLRLTTAPAAVHDGRTTFLAAVRTQANDLFHEHWGDASIAMWCGLPLWKRQFLITRGINIAALLGVLFSAGLFPIEDLRRCVGTLLEDTPFIRLRALHALLMHAGPEFYSGAAREESEALLEPLFAQVDDRFFWGPDEKSYVLVAEMYDMVQGWIGSDDDMRKILG